MKTNIYTVLLLASILWLSSCAGSKKVDFSTAYKFSRYNNQKINDIPEEEKKDINVTTELYASNKLPTENQDENLERFEQVILDKINMTRADAYRMEPETLAKKIDQLDRKEKRDLKKEIKAKLKQLKKSEDDYPSSITERSQTNELTEFMRLSIIVGSVGLVLLLLGAIFGISFLSIVGTLAIVGAAVLFILDQV